MDQRFKNAIAGFSSWLGRRGDLSPELFLIVDLVTSLGSAPGVVVSAISAASYLSMSFFAGTDSGNEDWLWTLDVEGQSASITIRTSTQCADGRTFVASLLSEVHSILDAAQIAEWWGRTDCIIASRITIELPDDSQELLDLISNLDRATRETGSLNGQA